MNEQCLLCGRKTKALSHNYLCILCTNKLGHSIELKQLEDWPKFDEIQ